MAEQEVRIRVWISEDVSKRLDAYTKALPQARVAQVVDQALDAYLSEQGY